MGRVSRKVSIKRVYESRTPSDGKCVLVDRIWPRGLTKEKLADAIWLKDIAPSANLRKWFDHDPMRWAEFRTRYRAELDGNPAAIEKMKSLCAGGPVTLLYSARDEECNQAAVLAEYLSEIT